MLRAIAALCAISVMAAAQFVAPAAPAATLTTLHAFCAKENCVDGATPADGLVRDPSGNLYGMAAFGGLHYGVVYALIKTADGWKYRVAHSFCAETGCPDGEFPGERLISDAAGNVYGVAGSGGAHGNGVVFELTPNARRSKWKFGILHAFCPKDGCADGSFPFGPLTYAGAASGAFYDGVSPLYGSTASGGIDDHGVVFRLSPRGRGWKQDVLYRFCAKPNGSNHCPDGESPSGALYLSDAGTLFGATESGGVYSEDEQYGGGTVFELDPRDAGKSWRATVLHRFCAQAGCADGSLPSFGIVPDGQGGLLGIASADGPHHGGVIYALVPNGRQSQYTVLHGFCAEPECFDADRRFPASAVTLDGQGNLFGEALSNPGGVIYRMHGTDFEEIYAFCAQAGCADGSDPGGGLLPVADGRYAGVTSQSGAGGKGTVFEFTP